MLKQCKVILADSIEALGEFKNCEGVFVVPVKPYLVWELKQAGFSNMICLGDYLKLKFTGPDEMQAHYKEKIKSEISLPDSGNAASWDNLQQVFLLAYSPVLFLRECLTNMVRKREPLEFEVKIKDPHTRLIFEEALKGIL